MYGLIYKDYIEISDNYKKYIISYVLLIIGGILSKSLTMLMFFPFLLSTNEVLNILLSDASSNWKDYIISLPLSRNKIVLSKYIFSFLIVAIFNILSLVITFTINYFLKIILINELFINYFLIIAISIIFIDIIIPIVYKYGLEKVRTLISVIFLFGIMLLYGFEKYIGIKNINNYFIILILTVIISIISLFISKKYLETNRE